MRELIFEAKKEADKLELTQKSQLTVLKLEISQPKSPNLVPNQVLRQSQASMPFQNDHIGSTHSSFQAFKFNNDQMITLGQENNYSQHHPASSVIIGQHTRDSHLDLQQHGLVTRQGSMHQSTNGGKPVTSTLQILDHTKANDVVRRKALFEMKSALLNKKEIDLRRTMAEAVADYPHVQEQRKIIHKHIPQLSQGGGSNSSHSTLQKHQKSFHDQRHLVSGSPQISFQKDLGKSLADSQNKKELIDIIKSKLIQATGKDKCPPQDHLKLFDQFIRSDIVKQMNMPKKKHYFSSKVTDAIEETDQIQLLVNSTNTSRLDDSPKVAVKHNSNFNIRRSIFSQDPPPAKKEHLSNLTLLSKGHFLRQSATHVNHSPLINPSGMSPRVVQEMQQKGTKLQVSSALMQSGASTNRSSGDFSKVLSSMNHVQSQRKYMGVAKTLFGRSNALQSASGSRQILGQRALQQSVRGIQSGGLRLSTADHSLRQSMPRLDPPNNRYAQHHFD
ncbi:hypothetical protein FGO68_gene17375 [Halteria grandinella]|uniref:Uncharacterized protein n=1 Tax=Halteria grandinella TaxID=5974 RepID=A0A8J8NEM4_HALGN|nr:hypothetical protein FGO68_gene17375 [Halteria grandinella]